jgi:hypothetical protein
VVAFLALYKDGVIDRIRAVDDEAIFTDSGYADAA